jgi:hypothetical protein
MKGFSAFTKNNDDIVKVPGGNGLTVDVNTGEVIKRKPKMTKKTGKFKKRPTPPNKEKDEFQPPPRKERGGGVVKN